MAGELIRPGVEVIQTFRSASPSFTRPTLAPCIVGPAFEVINVLNSDSTINSKAKYGAYAQIGKTITQSAFPDPRGNIDELNILEETIKPYMVSGGNLSELLMNPGESFLAASHVSSRAAIKTKAFGVGLALGGKVLVLAIDQPARLSTADDITITFTGGTLTAAQAVEQINTAVGEDVASVVDTDKVMIASLRSGALSSVTVRSGASANSLLEIGYDTVGSTQREERVEGSGFRGQDDVDNDTLTPWIEFYRGDFLVNGSSSSFVSKVGLINVETSSFTSAQAAAVTFGDSGSIPVHVGDYFFADGVKVKGGEIMKVEAARLKIGTINTALSTANDAGRYISKVYDVQEVGTLFDTTPFAPKYVWFKATGLDDATAVPVAASVTGSVVGAAAEQAVVTGSGAGAGPFTLTGLTLHYVVTINGVETEGTFVFTGSYLNMAAVAAALTIPGVVASDSAGQLRLTTTAFGRLQAVKVKSDGTSNSVLGFSTSSDTSASGKDVEFKDIPAILTGGAQTFNFAPTIAHTLIVETSNDGGATWTAGSRTFTWPSAGPFANAAALVAALNTAGSWDGGTLPTTFTIANVGNAITITSTALGSTAGLRIGAGSTGIAGAANASLQFTALQNDIGEENLSGQVLRFQFDSNPHIYEASFASDSLDEAVDLINALVGATVASKAGSNNVLKLTSPLKGAASKVTVISGKAQAAFGLSLTPATGTGRPFPDAYLDGLNNLVIGSQILRDQVTGYPLDFTFDAGTLYVQFKALRRDVSPLAAEAGVLRIPDTDTLASVLDPITEENPLGLGMYLAMLNCPGFEVKGLGVDEVTAAAPEGTALAYSRAAGLLEAEEVYAIAPLTTDEVVTGMWRTHVVAMSDPSQGGERIVFFGHKMPVTKNPGIAASGSQANSTATANQLLLDTNPAAGLVALGLNPADPFAVSDGVYVEVEVAGELRRYSVGSVSGALANLNVTFTGSENSDAFYTTTALTEVVVNSPWAMKVRGESLVIPGSNPARMDYSLVSETVAEANAGYKNRRAYSIFPDAIKTTINGIEKSLPSYYACAAIAGMTAGQPPQQGFTNFPITGLTGVVGSEKFTKRQLNVMAGGGTYILVQDVTGGPVTARHQVSTDLTSIEFRELSITKVVDFVAKYLRLGVRKFIGTQVINNQLLDTIGSTLQGMLTFLIESGVLNGANINNIVQDESSPDTILVDITLDVPYPCNYIRITLVV